MIPVEHLNTLTGGFREGLERDVLRYQYCVACGTAQTLTRYLCTRCGSAQLRWRDSCGNGTVFSVTLITRAPSEEFRALAPYTLVLVDLDEGCRVMGLGAAGLTIGVPVRASYLSHGPHRLVIFHPDHERIHD